MSQWTINFLNGREPLVIEGKYFAEAVEAYLQKNNDLSNANLSHADLNNAFLINANLSHADLRCAYLNHTVLSNADLRYADLNNAFLNSADLSNANLSYANLSHAKLNSTILSNADLVYAKLRYADLNNVFLNSADLSNADLSYADLSYADVRNAKLSTAELRYADLRNAQLNNAILRNAILRNANLDYSCFSLFCGSLDIKIDKRIACQLLYHTLRAMQSVDDEEVRAVLNDDKVLALANQFHRVEECGKIEKDIPQNNQSDPFGVENIEDVCTKRVEAWLNAPAESEGEDE